MVTETDEPWTLCSGRQQLPNSFLLVLREVRLILGHAARRKEVSQSNSDLSEANTQPLQPLPASLESLQPSGRVLVTTPEDLSSFPVCWLGFVNLA